MASLCKSEYSFLKNIVFYTTFPKRNHYIYPFVPQDLVIIVHDGLKRCKKTPSSLSWYDQVLHLLHHPLTGLFTVLLCQAIKYFVNIFIVFFDTNIVLFILISTERWLSFFP